MEKLDLMQRWRDLYRPPSDGPVLVEVPALSFLMVDGSGDPNTSPNYREAVEILFSTAYTVKFAVKRGPLALDFKVMPLEGLWWAEDMSAFLAGRKDEWKWTMMIALPDVVTEGMVTEATAEVARKKHLPAPERLRLEAFSEGSSAQMMHIGPYAEERPTIEKIHAFIAEHGLVPRGAHHEIYLGDPRKSAPERLHTIVRQPVAKP